MRLTKITVAGSGVLGSQIAFQTAFKGFEVAVYDVSEEAIEKGIENFKALMPRYMSDLKATKEEVEAAYHRLSLYTDLKEAVKDADLVIEAVPELIEIKKAFYGELSKFAPEKTIFASNSSTMIPSQFASFTGRPEKYLHLHFANEIWNKNIGEVMKHSGTDEAVFNEVIEFTKAIGMVPVPIHKEQHGYVLNTLLVPFLGAAQHLLVNGISDFESIDKTWMISTGAPLGPFAIMDVVGMNTIYNLSLGKSEAGDENARKVADYLKKEIIDKGRKTFYDYPNPSYLAEDFLK